MKLPFNPLNKLTHLIWSVEELFTLRKPRIYGLIVVRNEGHIIQDSLEHMLEFCDHIYLFDDCSEDNTFDIASKTHGVTAIQGQTWMSQGNRYYEETKNRQTLLEFARKHAKPRRLDWFLYMDGDERLDFNLKNFTKTKLKGDAYIFRLFDFYITEQDKNLEYKFRQFMGPEYRDIIFLFRNRNTKGYSNPIQREASLHKASRLKFGGYVKHYGKSISVEHWEKKCDYYAAHFPKYAAKWKERKGKAIHTLSDQGNELITWDERFSKKIQKL